MKLKPLMVILTTFNGVAEWGMVKNRCAPHILSKITTVQGTPITIGTRNIELTLSNGQKVHLRWFDVRLLCPASYGSLGKASALLGDEGASKHQLPKFWITRMERLKNEYPEVFFGYAIRDAETTLRLFLSLQDQLGALVEQFGGEKRKLYLTLGGSAVAAMRAYFGKRGVPILPETKDEKRNSEETRALWAAAYSGGRCESYLRDIEGKLRMVFLDLDFRSAYPMALAILPRIDWSVPAAIRRTCLHLDEERMAQLRLLGAPADLVSEFALHVAIGRGAAERFLGELARTEG